MRPQSIIPSYRITAAIGDHRTIDGTGQFPHKTAMDLGEGNRLGAHTLAMKVINGEVAVIEDKKGVAQHIIKWLMDCKDNTFGKMLKQRGIKWVTVLRSREILEIAEDRTLRHLANV